jgi:lysozyme family protein
MCNVNFDYCVPFILELEGGYVNDPNDPGGETNFGISKRAYPNLDIAGLTEASASAIYYQDYWLKWQCGQMPAHLDLWYFNACVMSGGAEAVKLLQKLIGVTGDGVFGPATLAALKAFPASRYHEYLTLYLLHLQSLGTWGNFGKGWTNRLFFIAAL